MKFKKVLVTGLSESEMEQKYWKRINKIAEVVEFSTLGGNDLFPLLADVDCLFIKFNEANSKMIDRATNLKYIGVFGTGYGKVDVKYAKEKGIVVTNIPGYSTQSVSEFVFAVLLEYLRDIKRAKIQGREGNYSESGFTATEIKGKKLGIIGLGQIGLQTAKIALGFGAKVKYWSQNEKNVSGEIEYSDIDQIVASSDILSLHLALNSDTEGFLDSNKIEKIKPGAIVINTSPMELIDLDALALRLEKGDITFIMDHADEMSKQDLDKITKYKNCIIYPPIGYISNEAGIAKQEIFVSNVEGVVGGVTKNQVE